MIYRHGDLCIRSIEQLPKGMKKVNTNILAEGEATGHAHTLVGKDFDIYTDDKGTMYFRAGVNTKIDHQEHKLKPIKEDYYKVDIEEEFDPFTEELNKVRD